RVDQVAPGAAQRQSVVAPAAEADLGMGEGQIGDGAHRGRRLAALAAEEGGAGRRVVEGVAALDRRARGTSRGPILQDLAGPGMQQPGAVLSGGAAGDPEVADGGDAGQRLPPEAEAPDPGEVVDGPELGGGMAGDRQTELVTGDAGAVVGHHDAYQTASLQVDVDARRPGVERVLAELLDGGGGPFDDF